MVNGEQFVMTIGTLTMLVLSADSLVFQKPRSLGRIVTLVEELDKFCLTILVVTVMSHRYFHVLIEEWENTTVVIMRTRGYAVKKLKVRMNDKKIKHVQKMRQPELIELSKIESIRDDAFIFSQEIPP